MFSCLSLSFILILCILFIFKRSVHAQNDFIFSLQVVSPFLSRTQTHFSYKIYWNPRIKTSHLRNVIVHAHCTMHIYIKWISWKNHDLNYTYMQERNVKKKLWPRNLRKIYKNWTLYVMIILTDSNIHRISLMERWTLNSF